MKILYFSLLLFVFSTPIAFAACTTSSDCSSGQTCRNSMCVTDSAGSAGSSGGVITLQNPLANADGTNPGISELIGRGIKGLLSVIGSIALVLIIYGGFTWMTAAGSAEKVTKGRDIIVYVALGLIVIFSAYAILKFIFSALAGTSS